MHHGNHGRPEKGCSCGPCGVARVKHAAVVREHRRRNAERINAQRRARVKTEEQREGYRRRNKKYVATRSDEMRQRAVDRTLAWRAENPEKARAAVRAWSARNPDTVRRWQREKFARWKLRDPEGYKAYKSVQKHQRRDAPGKFSKVQFQARWDYFAGLCYLCGAKADTIDHVIPLSRGGTNWPSNLRPACMDCNRRKYNRPPTR